MYTEPTPAVVANVVFKMFVYVSVGLFVQFVLPRKTVLRLTHHTLN